MILKIMSWNVGGAKYLKLPERDKDGDNQRYNFRNRLNTRLEMLLEEHKPDIVLLQEIVRYSNPNNPNELLKEFPNYYYLPSITIDTINQQHPRKWDTYRKKGCWNENDYLGQGLGILWRKDLGHCPMWNFSNPTKGHNLQVESVRIDTGLYTGDRDTEPRLVVVAHFILDTQVSPLDVFVANVHLTTLKHEREGYPEKDDQGCEIRMGQIDTILHGIVSRYNEWRLRRLEEKEQEEEETQRKEKKQDKANNETGEKKIYRLPPVWIFGGDFNCTPDSPEISKIKRLNFTDLNLNKGKGTKASGLYATDPIMTVDYIFAGLNYMLIDPDKVKMQIEQNPEPLYPNKNENDTSLANVSDHFPIIAQLPISLHRFE